MNKKYRIKRSDEVIVIAGKHKGSTGKIKQIITKKDRVIIDGVAKIKRHIKPTPQAPQGVLEKEASIHISNVALLDPESKKPTKVGFKFDDKGNKQRIAKQSGKVLSA